MIKLVDIFQWREKYYSTKGMKKQSLWIQIHV